MLFGVKRVSPGVGIHPLLPLDSSLLRGLWVGRGGHVLCVLSPHFPSLTPLRVFPDPNTPAKSLFLDRGGPKAVPFLKNPWPRGLGSGGMQ